MGTLKAWIDYLNSIEEEDRDSFFKPYKEGKWSKAAIISHMMYWDRFFYEERLPHMLKGKDLVGITAEQVEEMNKKAEEYAHSGISLQKIIEEALHYRQMIINELQDKDLTKTFTIKERKISLHEYVDGEVEHDQHHLKQLKAK
ncbi:MAG: DinB family protein [Heyndrickxia sp.]